MSESSVTQEPIAIVTGGSRGIGKAVVEHLCRAGVDVLFTYLNNDETANTLVETLRAEGHRVRATRADSRDISALSALTEATISERGRLDILVNNAGITADRLLMNMSDDEWSNVLATSLNGLFGATRRAARQMMRQRSGRIVNLTSVSGLIGMQGQTNYCAAKSAIIGFTRALSKELAPYGACANAVAPGYIDTDMLAGFSATQRTAIVERVPMKRLGTSDEVARLVRFLVLEAPPYLTGQTLVLDGGLTA